MRIACIAIAALTLSASTVSAQRLRDENNPRRAQLEQEFRERGEKLVRERLGLNDDQMRRLRDVNAGISQRRNVLLRGERQTHLALRDELARGSAADQAKVSQLMGQERQYQSQRLTLQQEEQQQLGQFMTPVQVAGYYGLQAQLRQRMRQLRQQSGDAEPMDTP